MYEVGVECGGNTDTLRLLSREASVELRIFMDWTFIEAYFQRGRAAITRSAALDENTTVALSSDANVTVASARVYPMASIWASEAEVRAAPRVYT